MFWGGGGVTLDKSSSENESDEVWEPCTRRDSDESEDDVSDEDSKISCIDSVAEEMFWGGGGVTLDKSSSENESDEVWEPY
ncbi:hypothetical protein F2P79_005966 [Pimephales promelas]|nr:hypothetical protein F2P79_005966 [Pimephales promelas]